MCTEITKHSCCATKQLYRPFIYIKIQNFKIYYLNFNTLSELKLFEDLRSVFNERSLLCPVSQSMAWFTVSENSQVFKGERNYVSL